MIQELSRAEVDGLLQEQVVGRIGCHAGGVTYVVPVIYAYDGESIYVATVEGLKTSMMRENPQVCFEVDEYDAGSWRSAIVQGVYDEIPRDEAGPVIELLAARFGRTGENRARRRHGSGAEPVFFRIQAVEVTGRAVTR